MKIKILLFFFLFAPIIGFAHDWPITGISCGVIHYPDEICEYEKQFVSNEYTCLICGLTFEGYLPSGCLVNHRPGECCHYYDTRIFNED